MKTKQDPALILTVQERRDNNKNTKSNYMTAAKF